MVFGTLGKRLCNKIKKNMEGLDDGRDERVEKFMDAQYFYLLQLSTIYVKLDRKHRLISILQILSFFCIILYHMVLLVRSTFLTFNFGMVLFSQNVHFILLLAMPLFMIIFSLTKRTQVVHLHRIILNGFFDYEEPAIPGEEDLRSSMVRELRLLVTIPLGVVFAGGFILVASPVVDRMVGTFDKAVLEREFSSHLPYPYGKYPYQTKEGFSYYVTFGGQVLVPSLAALIIASSGFFLLITTLNMILQFKLLHNSIDHLDDRAQVMYCKLYGKPTTSDFTSMYEDPQFRFCYNMCLRKNFRHHQVILRTVRNLEGMTSLPMFFSYITGTLIIALSFIATGSVKELPGTTLCAMTMCGVEIGYMFLFSSLGQRICDLNSDLRFKIYSIKWYICDKKTKSSLSIFLDVTLKPLKYMAVIIPANMETFAAVLRSAYSYYNLINAFEK